MELLPDPGPVPVAQPAPTGHATATAHLLGQVLPLDARLQHKENARERLAVRHQYRRTRVSFKLVQAAVDYIKRKGFRKIYGLAQDRLVNFWAHFGGRPLEGGRKVTFSDFSYTEMVFDIEPPPDAITLASDPYVIIRPEGDWDRPGVLDYSAQRAVTSPLRNMEMAET